MRVTKLIRSPFIHRDKTFSFVRRRCPDVIVTNKPETNLRFVKATEQGQSARHHKNSILVRPLTDTFTKC